MFKLLRALAVEPIGGARETGWLLVIAISLFSAFPPFAGFIASFPVLTALTIKLSLLALAGYGAYVLGYAALKKRRRTFILPSSCGVESSDTPQQHETGLLLGYTTDDGSPLALNDDELCRHGLIMGATGVGKTVLGRSLMYQQMQRGGGLLFIDGKLDSDNIQDFYAQAVYAGRGQDVYVINPGDPQNSNTYNPILDGDPDEVASRIMNLIPSTGISAGADYYRQSANLALVVFLSAFKESLQEPPIASSKGRPQPEQKRGVAYNFLDLALLTMNEGVLNNLLQRVRESAPDSLARKNLTIFLEQYARDKFNPFEPKVEAGSLQIDLEKLKQTLGGISSRMHQFGSSKFGEVLNSYTPDLRIYEAIRDGKLVYMALPTMGKDIAAQNLARMAIGDLRTAVSWLQVNKEDRPKIPFLAFLDEMSSYANETQAIMFEQFRSANVALLPAIQTDSGLINVNEDFKERIMANTAMKVFFRLESQITATTASETIGMTRRAIVTESDTKGVSESAKALEVGLNKGLSDSSSSGRADREQEEPLVTQDHLKSLTQGECIVFRSPRVWNIRVPLIDLDEATRAAIGPLRINHKKGRLSKHAKFNAIGNVDRYIEEAQKRRAWKLKKKDGEEESEPQNVANLPRKPQ